MARRINVTKRDAAFAAGGALLMEGGRRAYNYFWGSKTKSEKRKTKRKVKRKAKAIKNKTEGKAA